MSQKQGTCDQRVAESATQQERVSGLRQVRMTFSDVKAGLSPRILAKAPLLSLALQLTPKLLPAQRHATNISALISKAAVRLHISLALLIMATSNSFGRAPMRFSLRVKS